MQRVRPDDGDRLPWLEPYRETKAAGRPLPRRGYRKPVAAGVAIGLLLAVGGAGYWLGQRSDQPPVEQPSATVAVPPARPAPVEVAEAPPPAAIETAEPQPVEPPAVDEPKPAKKVTKRKSPPRKKIRTAGVQKSRLDSVRAAQNRRASSRAWPKMPSPGPAGQVIQLGAFSTPARAHAAYAPRVARYPVLARMPKVVVPVVTKPDGRVLYVLRLGTASRQQSKTVCRNLRASGDHCLVIG
jgi:hypothetical protein